MLEKFCKLGGRTVDSNSGLAAREVAEEVGDSVQKEGIFAAQCVGYN